jgi:uncharacterized 2Fe-2S/4Fe-4S cluster protein (DUF4445 family)
MAELHKVIFQPSGRRGEVDEGLSILEASRRLGVDIEAICGEKKTCGKCRVKIEDGFFERYGIISEQDHLSPFQVEEERYVKTDEDRAEGYRLACVAKILGDILVFVPEKSRAGKQVVRKPARKLDIPIKPAVKKYYAELTKATLADCEGDWERLQKQLKKKYGLDGLTIDYHTLLQLQNTVRQGDWKLTATVWNNKEVIKVEPGKNDTYYGLAVDVGTTTVVGYLTDLNTGEVPFADSMMNPQVTYGEDVMSRITYAMTHMDEESGHSEGLERMNLAIRQGLDVIAGNVAEAAGITTDDILEMTIVGNTCMHHIFLNIYPEYIGLSPFPPALHHSIDIKARDFGINILPSAYVHVLPIEAGFVGADNVGVLICEAPHKQDSMMLAIDIGTNGELLLGDRRRVISSSCATGPALEGAHIEFGMRAAPGSIEKVEIDPVTKEPRYKVIGQDTWSDEMPKEEIQAKGMCGSGIIDVMAELFKAGIITKSGRLNKKVESPRLIKNEKGKPEKYVLAWADETSIEQDITVNQADVRAFQLAKGALYTGAKIMMGKLGIDKLDRVALAGAFGSHINPHSAAVVGMFPDCEPDKVGAVGNAAGDGARMALINTDVREEADIVAREVEYIELTLEKSFQRDFMEAMHFPHMKDDFPNLKEVLAAIPDK